MMPKITTYRSRPKICTSSSSLFDEIIDSEIFHGKVNSKSKIFDDVTNKKNVQKKNSKSRFKSRLREDADQLPMTVCGFILMRLFTVLN